LVSESIFRFIAAQLIEPVAAGDDELRIGQRHRLSGRQPGMQCPYAFER
jgi:hypothetical protein